MTTFFTIQVPHNAEPREWARMFWDFYGFDWDPARCGPGTILAWPVDDVTDNELSRALEDDDIEYETFEVKDVDRFFGLK